MVKSSLLFLLFACAVPFSVSANPSFLAAPAASHLERPLVIIRFNQQRVHYQKPLYAALSRAIAAEPTVQFQLVSYVPLTRDRDLNQRWQQSAAAHTREVMASMQQMGVPASQMKLVNRPDASLKYDELHIFVR